MFRRNLITIAILSLVLIFTSNAFGQWHKDFPSGLKSPRQITKQKVKGKKTSALKSDLPKPKDYIGETEKNFSRKRRSLKSKVKKNQDIEVENDETHRTKH